MSDAIIYLKSGATENDIQNALDKLSSGGTLVLPENETIRVTQGITINGSRDITLDLNGSTLQQAGDVYVLSINGKMEAAESTSIGTDGSGHVTGTFSSASSVAVGDWVKLFSDDDLPNDQGASTKLGQAMKVIAVNGNTVTFEGDLVNGDLYKTNVRTSKFDASDVTIENGTIRGDQSHPDWQAPLLSVRSTVNTHVDNVTVRDGNSMGMNFVNTVNALVTQSAAINLTNDTPHGHYGYGVHSASSVGTTVDGLYAENVRHAVDDNAIGLNASSDNPSKYGADIGITATNVVANGVTSYAFSWHSEGRQGSYSDSVVFNSYGVVGARGTDNSVSNISGANNVRGILYFEYGDGDGRNIKVDNVMLKEISQYGVMEQNDATGNSLTNSYIQVINKSPIVQWLNKAATTDLSGQTLALSGNTILTGVTISDETITGTSGTDRLLGGAGIDTISGGKGNDYIWGGAEADILTGGDGSDRFAYLSIAEGGDIITDFKAGAGGDVIDLAALSRTLGWKGDLIANGYVRFIQSGADTLVQVDSNGGANSFATLATLKGTSAAAITSKNLSTDIVVSDYSDASAGQPNTGPVVSIPVSQPSISTPVGTPVVTAPIEADPVQVPSVSTADATAFNALTGMAKVLGTSAVDTLNGGNADDLLIGGAGDDTLVAGAGNDVLAGGAGADALFGGSGRDTASYADALSGVTASLKDASINTGDAQGDKYSQIENLAGSKFNDVLHGNDAVNELDGGAGNDKLYGWGGTDMLYGGAGDDILDGGAQNDTLDGGAGNDRLIGGDGYDKLTGGTGNDIFVLDASFTDSSDTILDFVSGEDKISLAGTGLSTLSGIKLEIDRKLAATTAAPTLLYSDTTGALLYDADGSGAGAAIKIGTLAQAPILKLSDFILGFDMTATAMSAPVNESDDTPAFQDQARLVKVVGTSGSDTLTGGATNDLLIGGAGDDTLIAGSGNDVLAGGAGADALFGGSGRDTASYANALSGITASLKDTSLNTGDAKGDTYSQIENLTGSKFDDVLHGNDAVNELNGGAGNDKLYGWGGTDTLNGGAGDDILDGGAQNDALDGGAGNDRLIGGAGYDSLTGGAGNDTFVLDTKIKDSFDTIVDFTSGEDHIGLAGTGLKSLSNVHFEVTSSLVATTHAPTILYSDRTGALLYDADGSGSGAAVKIGMIDHAPDLHMSDFILI